MRLERRIGCIVPAVDEELAIGQVIAAVPRWVDSIIVADNGSTDATARIALEHGASVVHEPRRGYGAACLAGIAALPDVDVVVFLDGDLSDHPEDMDLLVDPIARGEADLVIGSRVLGNAERGALTPQQRFGNWLATRLIRAFWNVRFTDLGPFRAIGRAKLDDLGMQDQTFGWTVEMQIKAARDGLRTIEVPIRYRRRIGASKISGTLKGTVLAGIKILSTIAREAARGRNP
ncbi:MAG: glycosyltransferase family 2 protein [Hyphomicrobiaceae bacterium]